VREGATPEKLCISNIIQIMDNIQQGQIYSYGGLAEIKMWRPL
jgi:alkylated DNA nucleotide flippase Atl1